MGQDKKKNIHYQHKVTTFLSIKKREHKSLEKNEFFFGMNKIGVDDFPFLSSSNVGWDDFNFNIFLLDVILLCFTLSHATYITVKP